MEVEMDTPSRVPSSLSKRRRSPLSSPGSSERPKKRPNFPSGSYHSLSRPISHPAQLSGAPPGVRPTTDDWVTQTRELRIDQDGYSPGLEQGSMVGGYAETMAMTMDNEVSTLYPSPPPPNSPIPILVPPEHCLLLYPPQISDPQQQQLSQSGQAQLQLPFVSSMVSISVNQQETAQYDTSSPIPLSSQNSDPMIQSPLMPSINVPPPPLLANPRYPTPNTTRRPRFTMGPRAGCEKCRLGVPGHWAHLD